MQVNGGCLEFRQGFCGWVNSKKSTTQWKQTKTNEEARLAHVKPGKNNFFLNSCKNVHKTRLWWNCFCRHTQIFLSFSLSSPSPSLSFCFIWQYSPPRTNNLLVYLLVGVEKESSYQLNFTANHSGYVNITDLPDLVAFTVCFWMKSSDDTSAGTPFWYRVRYEKKGRYVTAIALIDYRGFYVYTGETKSYVSFVNLS